jgi:hypothetical protein
MHQPRGPCWLEQKLLVEDYENGKRIAILMLISAAATGVIMCRASLRNWL